MRQHQITVFALLSLLACSPEQQYEKTEQTSANEKPELTAASPWKDLFPYGNYERLDSSDSADIPSDIFECPPNAAIAKTLKTVGRKMRVKIRSNPEYIKTGGETDYSPYQPEFEKLGCRRIKVKLAVAEVIDWVGDPYYTADRWIAFRAKGRGESVYLHYFGGID